MLVCVPFVRYFQADRVGPYGEQERHGPMTSNVGASPRTRQHDVRLAAALVARPPQIPAPRVQCSTASSIGSQSGVSFFPATTTWT